MTRVLITSTGQSISLSQKRTPSAVVPVVGVSPARTINRLAGLTDVNMPANTAALLAGVPVWNEATSEFDVTDLPSIDGGSF